MPNKPKMVWTICQMCKRPFQARAWDLKRTGQKRRKYCGKKCRNHAPKINVDNTGESNPNWRGGRVCHKKGYIYVYVPDHPRASAGPGGNYVFEHILVAERMLGRHLLPDEVVHHKNGKKWDNRPENLAVFASVSDHSLHHHGHNIKAAIGL